jgi:KUP system potassium uptake protein
MAEGSSTTTADANGEADATPAPASFFALALGSVGVVYGDIGTSPLYAFREAAIAAATDNVVTRDIVLGVLSLIVWALIVIVALKYVTLLLRADNNGEGGTLSLTALASRALGRRAAFIYLAGIIGAAMFLGDSMITPAISVLSAVEGLKLASPVLDSYVAPLAVVILILLFAVQSRGTAKVAALFGPIMVVWFLAIAVAGAMHIRDDVT